MSIFSKILSKIIPVPKIVKQNKFLFIGPHPDDIEIGAGATALRLKNDGKDVKFLICTDGRYGTEDPEMNLDELVKIRQKEAIAAAANLGVTDVQFLPFPDGGNYNVYELTKEISKVICEFKPDFIFAPDPKLINECHIDHLNVGNAVSNAFIMSGTSRYMQELGCEGASVKGIAYYYTDKPTQYVATPKLVDKQLETILLFSSQFSVDTPIGQETMRGFNLYIKMRSKIAGLKILRSSAEGFRVLGSMHIHCAPEAAKIR
jgi:LmbE family N-acetylglucosaminyl deacetylase